MCFKEVLREKQNHIEHLLIERDLDRQDSENNAMMYQKTINQVCTRPNSLNRGFYYNFVFFKKMNLRNLK